MFEVIESVQQFFTAWLSDVTAVLPFGFAFGAGVVSTVNPCGFVMLPVYLGLYLGRKQAREQAANLVSNLARAVVVSVSMSAGIVILFAIAGSVIAGGGSLVIDVLPWAGVAIGALLIIAAGRMFLGSKMYAGRAAEIASNIGDARRNNVGGYFLFGIAFAVASLSCTLPIFLAVVGTTLVAAGFVDGALQFVSYALGMASVIAALTYGMVFFQTAVSNGLKSAVRYSERIGPPLMLAAGVYILYYWLVKAGLYQSFG